MAVNVVIIVISDKKIVNISLTYNSANSARIQWQLADNNTPWCLTEIQLILNGSRCGDGKSLLIQNKTETNDLYVRFL